MAFPGWVGFIHTFWFPLSSTSPTTYTKMAALDNILFYLKREVSFAPISCKVQQHEKGVDETQPSHCRTSLNGCL